VESEPEAQILDCAKLPHAALLQALTEAEPESLWKLQSVQPTVDGFAAGIASSAHITCAGNVGDFAFLLGELDNFELHGNAGDCCAHSLVSGRLLVRGSAGDFFGAYATGGFLVVHSTVKNHCGYRLSGAEMFVRGTAGDGAGSHMRDGALVLGNGAGKNTGLGMRGGTLYIRGEVQSLAEEIKPIRMKDADTLRLSLLLARAGVKGGVKEFKAYRPKAGS
jgi:glutamate synthase domain-containing protein 3